MHNFQSPRRTLTQCHDLIVRQSGVASVDVSNHVGIGFKHHVFVDQAGAGDRRPSRVNRALDAVFACPCNHLARGLTVFNAAESYFAQYFDSSCGEFFEIVFDHSMFDDRRARINFYSSRTKGLKGALGKNGHCLQSDNIFRTARCVHFTRRNHRRDTAVHIAVDPAQLILARRPVSADRVNVAVDEAGGKGCALGINGDRGSGSVHIFVSSNRSDAPADRDNRIRIEDGIG